jgi:hypothetical protein
MRFAGQHGSRLAHPKRAPAKLPRESRELADRDLIRKIPEIPRGIRE